MINKNKITHTTELFGGETVAPTGFVPQSSPNCKLRPGKEGAGRLSPEKKMPLAIDHNRTKFREQVLGGSQYSERNSLVEFLIRPSQRLPLHPHPMQIKNRPKTSPLVRLNWKSNRGQTLPNIPFYFLDDFLDELSHPANQRLSVS